MAPDETNAEAPAVPAPAVRADEERAGWERLWVETLKTPWSSLAFIPAHPGLTAVAAEPLARVGREYLGTEVRAVAAENLTLAECRVFLEGLERNRADGQRTVIALGSPIQSQAALLVARAVDVAVLVVALGASPLASARATVEAVGAERFVGSVLVQAAER